ncbi:uncharacterized protein EMH_0088120 [Eimeria mitis]|uniref:Uncharacterized protein n=1 Tax=Eimeria mitis TaxID=44415 RepID=U6JTY5_9EIME|nr:uncharacterized protein EMH_0088120 [Eimeria mitis]CDJ27532.1 hypothetical protein EMH_0088120 [Eimeria mitis]
MKTRVHGGISACKDLVKLCRVPRGITILKRAHLIRLLASLAQVESTAETKELLTSLFLVLEVTIVVLRAQQPCRAYLALTVRLDRPSRFRALEGLSAP